MGKVTIGDLVALLIENRVSTAVLLDSLGKPHNYHYGKYTATTPSAHAVGVVHDIYTANGSNHDLHEQIQLVMPGEIAVIHTEACYQKAVIGELVTRYLIEERGAAGIVVNGNIRDVPDLMEGQYPVWYTGRTPLGAVNTPAPSYALPNKKLREGGAERIAVCDGDGVVDMPVYGSFVEGIMLSVESVLLNERIWFYCLVRGMSTYDIVCKKAYLAIPNYLPDSLQKALNANTAALESLKNDAKR